VHRKEAIIQCNKGSDGKTTCVLKSKKKGKGGKRKNLGKTTSKSGKRARDAMKKREKEVQTFKHMSSIQDDYLFTLLKLARLYRKVGEVKAAKQLEKRARIRYYAKRLENG